jgi:hypothetical protein
MPSRFERGNRQDERHATGTAPPVSVRHRGRQPLHEVHEGGLRTCPRRHESRGIRRCCRWRLGTYLRFALERAQRELAATERRQLDQAANVGTGVQQRAPNPQDDLNRKANALRLEVKSLKAQLGLPI